MTVFFHDEVRPVSRHFVKLHLGTVLMDERPVRVELRRGTISVGCADISIEAARHLVDLHAGHFPDSDRAFVIQTGEIPRP